MKKWLPTLNSFNVKRILFLTIFVFTSLFLHAQERGILLKNNSNQRTILLNENAKIKVQTMLGAKFTGNYTIIDDKTIMLQGQNITLESIFSIRSYSIDSLGRQSLSIFEGILVIGVSCIPAIGRMMNKSDPKIAEATLLLGTLTAATIITKPFILNKHYRQKWEYTIVTGK